MKSKFSDFGFEVRFEFFNLALAEIFNTVLNETGFGVRFDDFPIWLWQHYLIQCRWLWGQI